MTDSLPAPLTPADADLREFAFMPFDVVRFAQSDIVVQETPEAVLAAILLWGASWHSIPAGSLTDDDRTLANLAGYGRAVDAFRAVKEGALRGFVKCSDGRLYHSTVAEKVCESWAARLQHRHKAHQAAVRQHNKRNPGSEIEPMAFEDWDAAGRPSGVVTRDTGGLSRVTGDSVTQEATDLSRSSHAQIPSKGRDREGTGKGQGYLEQEEGEPSSSCAAPAETGADAAPRADGATETIPPGPPAVKKPAAKKKLELSPGELEEFGQFWAIYPLRKARANAEQVFARLRRDGVPLDAILTGAVTYAAERAGEDAKFTKYAEGWLSAGRWTDEPAAASFGSDMTGAARRRADRGGMQGYSALDQAIEGIAWDEERPQ